MCFTPFGRSCLWREMPVTVQPLVAIRCSARWRPMMPETPAISAWRSITAIPLPPWSRSKRHHRAIAGGRLDGGFENGDVVDEILSGNRIGHLAANGTGERDEVVLGRLCRRDVRHGERATGHGAGDDPAGGRLDMSLVPDIDP